MIVERIRRVEVLESGELFLGLETGDNASYQYIYREGRGIYWDPDRRGFKSTELKDWTVTQWFRHILAIAHEIGITLALSEDVSWENISEDDKILIRAGAR